MPPSRQDSDDANSVASYENQEPACENVDEDDDDEDYPNEGYLEVLPDSTPATSPAVSSAATAPSNPALGGSAVSVESVDDYVNVPESEDSAEASLDGSREYVNLSPELQQETRAERATFSSQEVENEEEEEETPDYENLQEAN